VPKKQVLARLSVYIPKRGQQARLGERLMKLAVRKDRSINYLIVEAIMEYLRRKEGE